ncbi:MAG: Phosphate starvation-inducible protein PsiF [Paracidovorax wautersii]|uniref:Phosphate starvation-inducible protein PsiF n=1 Tax=Paracidovorax wautersii TaxID=1177982 RepID=A0A7V8JQE7_9BURK|nr:MAG: Phosphate starvation-inducible protein PsiF [Paracidovorax wautersii]
MKNPANSKQCMWLSLVVAVAMTAAWAPVQAAEPTAQQNRMTACNQQATGKTGDDRKAFMKSCLSNKPKPVTQQDKMKSCNASATGKKGDERKAFMSDCLKKPA